ncbi:hypothetical protein EJB05_13357, partial [Eragrostis curvula]
MSFVGNGAAGASGTGPVSGLVSEISHGYVTRNWTELAFQYCEADYGVMVKTFPVCRNIFLNVMKPGDNKAEYSDDITLPLQCMDRIGRAATDCGGYLVAGNVVTAEARTRVAGVRNRHSDHPNRRPFARGFIYGCATEALDHLHQMARAGLVFNPYTYSTAFALAGMLSLLDLGRQLHGRIVAAALQDDSFVWCSLMDMYCKCGGMEVALSIFDRCSRFTSDVKFAWSTMVAGYVLNGLEEDALEFFRRMLREDACPV